MPSPSPLRETLDLMDRAERLAVDAFEHQGLSETGKYVSAARLDRESLDEPVSESGLTDLSNSSEETADHGKSTVNVFRAMLKILGVIALMVALVVVVGYQLKKIFNGTSGSAHMSDAQAVIDLRRMVAHKNINFVRQILNDPKENITQALNARGVVTLTDQFGWPAVEWAGVSSKVCTAMVKDIIQYPSKSEIGATVDGKNINVSCDGPSHTLVLAPRL
jgi:hypothetical protein